MVLGGSLRSLLPFLGAGHRFQVPPSYGRKPPFMHSFPYGGTAVVQHSSELGCAPGAEQLRNTPQGVCELLRDRFGASAVGFTPQHTQVGTPPVQNPKGIP